jgi:hypothetical protein
MGQEVECSMRLKRREVAGKALLETDHLLFRGEERLKVLFKDLKSVRAADGVLRLEFDGGPAELMLGKAAEKWAQKILHPPSRADKLGLKPGLTARLAGEFDGDLHRELEERGVTEARGKSDVVFFAVESATGLARLGKAASSMKKDGALWVVYPKGVKTIREIEVIEAGRSVGLKDVKVVGYSSTHTALKFVLPLTARGGRSPAED